MARCNARRIEYLDEIINGTKKIGFFPLFYIGTENYKYIHERKNDIITINDKVQIVVKEIMWFNAEYIWICKFEDILDMSLISFTRSKQGNNPNCWPGMNVCTLNNIYFDNKIEGYTDDEIVDKYIKYLGNANINKEIANERFNIDKAKFSKLCEYIRKLAEYKDFLAKYYPEIV